MIISRAPYRVSFFGGGTDYPDWYSKHGGVALSTTMDKYCYLNVRYMADFLGSKYRFFYSNVETVDRLEDIKHPGIRGCLQYSGITEGIEMNHSGDLPARTGLGTSSSFTVAMLQALHALKGETLKPRDLAAEAIHVEQKVLGETVGIQDQIAAAWGGFNTIRIDPDGRYSVTPVSISKDAKDKLESRLLLFYTGIQRHASEIAKSYATSSARNEVQLKEISILAFEALDALEKENLDEFGKLLHGAWLFKRSLSNLVSNDMIDEIYNRASKAGALGGKVLGAGGGGFILFYSPEPQKVRESLPELLEVPFKFGTEGSKIVLADM